MISRQCSAIVPLARASRLALGHESIRHVYESDPPTVFAMAEIIEAMLDRDLSPVRERRAARQSLPAIVVVNSLRVNSPSAH
jgi:hypothetical protein